MLKEVNKGITMTVSHKIINIKRQTLFLKWKLEVGKSTLK